jgi:Rrf2 family transcriptional regulator, iron-sulfur cluster assembly transcription factor
MFSKTCEYAIKIMIFISTRQEKDGERVGLDEIAEAIDSPKAFTAKVLQQLVKAKLLDSMRGRTGGFSIPQKGEEITLADIVKVIDGDKLLYGCVLGFSECSEVDPCPVHYKFKSVRDYLSGTLSSTKLQSIKGFVNDQGLLIKA